MTPEERRARPGDYEAQTGQGEITFHSEEHLTSTDRGVVMLRRLFQREIDKVKRGEDPVGLVWDEANAVVDFEAGNFLEEATSPT
jgi:hypothetical protein